MKHMTQTYNVVICDSDVDVLSFEFISVYCTWLTKKKKAYKIIKFIFSSISHALKKQTVEHIKAK